MSDIDKKKLKWYRIMETTLLNYNNMMKRLKHNDIFSDFVLIYYSIILIFLSSLSMYYPDCINERLCSFISLNMSVIVLVFSIINGSSNFKIRINNIELSLNKIKNLKREISEYSEQSGLESNEKEKKIQESIISYQSVVDSTEVRKDIDFYKSLKSMLKSCDKEKNSYAQEQLIEVNVKAEICKEIIKYVIEGVIIVAPIILTLVIFMCK